MPIRPCTLARQILPALLLAVGPAAWGANTWHTARPTQIYPHADGSFAITFDTDAGSTCTNHWGSGNANLYYVKSGQNSVTADAARSMLSVALTAQVLGRQLAIYYDNAVSYCYVNRLQVLDY